MDKLKKFDTSLAKLVGKNKRQIANVKNYAGDITTDSTDKRM